MTNQVLSLEKELKEAVSGDVLFDEMSRLIYSTDASLYQMIPQGIVLPKSKQDVVNTIRLAAQYDVPILGRGGGTSLAGQTVTSGIVIDFSKYMNRLLEVNTEEHWARVQPGIVLDNLNADLERLGFFFAPDVATSSRANVGGMMGNNSSGVRSVRYGKTVDHILAAEAILADGTECLFEQLSRSALEKKQNQQDREGEIYREVERIVTENRDEIAVRYPKVMRRVSGYNLDEVLDLDSLNVAKLLVGSEGTLATVTEIKINLEPIPKHKAVAVLHFDDLLTAIASVERILDYKPSAVEILDRYGLTLGKSNPVVARLCKQFLTGEPNAVLIVEFSDDDLEEVKNQFNSMKQDSLIQDQVFHIYEAWESSEQQIVWQVRKNALGVLLGIKGDFKPLPFIEDSCIPIKDLADYVAKIQEICHKYQRKLALYAHASVGVIHLRPLLNLKQQEDVEILQAISNEAFDLVQHYGGSWSGEHGDGLVRSYKIREFFGDQIYRALCDVKSAFDPKGLMNPGKIIAPPSMTENLRIRPGYKTTFPETYYRFQEEGGFDRAIEMCTGVGQCRKTLSGTMCPSFIATRDEEHSTRGRANALRSAIAGDLEGESFTSKRLYDVLDLCLECKACKSECPSSVDMAKMKAEFLAHYYKKHGIPFGKRLLGATRRGAEIASRIPSLSNSIMNSAPARWILSKKAGFDQRRKLPPFASETFEKWYRKNYTAPVNPTGSVVLFVDTFVNFYEPAVGKAAVKVMSALDLRVEVFSKGCCGRPLISAGLLERAKSNGAKVVNSLEQQIGNEMPIVVLEPSCYSTLKDDYPDLVEPSEQAARIARRIVSLEELVSSEGSSKKLAGLLKNGVDRILFHGHCQQKAICGSDPALHALSLIPGAVLDEVPSTCCGMAGSFGYEEEHYSLSEKIANRSLVPAVRDSSALTRIVVPGFSCRSQIQHFTGREAVHPAQALAESLKD